MNHEARSLSAAYVVELMLHHAIAGGQRFLNLRSKHVIVLGVLENDTHPEGSRSRAQDLDVGVVLPDPRRCLAQQARPQHTRGES